MMGMHGLLRLRNAALAFAGLWMAGAAPAWAQPVPGGELGAPRNWQTGFQAPQSNVQYGIEGLHSLILWLMAMVTVFVAALLLYCVWRFRESVNPKASRVSHHTALEVAWTVLPVLILVVIAIPSFRLIYYEDRTETPDLTVKVVGHQWLWEYDYPDSGVQYQSVMIAEDDLKPGQLRNLDVDNRLVLPAGKNVRILTTSGDVIHSFFIPSLGVQRYAIPGRTIETWVRVDKPGVYYGECNQICGTNHSAMPIAVQAMSDTDFAAWLEAAKTKFPAGAASNTDLTRQPTAVAELQR